MKKEFSSKWISSRKPRKQRKYRAMAPFHLKKEMLSSHLPKELRQKYGRRSFPIRKGDEVKVMNGEFKGKTGKVSFVDLKKIRVAVEGIQITKKDGSKVNVFFAPSKLLIKELNLDDNKRVNALKKSLNKEQKDKEIKTEKK